MAYWGAAWRSVETREGERPRYASTVRGGGRRASRGRPPGPPRGPGGLEVRRAQDACGRGSSLGTPTAHAHAPETRDKHKHVNAKHNTLDATRTQFKHTGFDTFSTWTPSTHTDRPHRRTTLHTPRALVDTHATQPTTSAPKSDGVGGQPMVPEHLLRGEAALGTLLQQLAHLVGGWGGGSGGVGAGIGAGGQP